MANSAEQATFNFNLTITEKFEVFHEKNPQVFTLLESMAKEMIEGRGRRKIGISLLCEVLRWNYYMATNDPNSEFKINNNYRASYARMLVAVHPEWGDVFSLRELRSV